MQNNLALYHAVMGEMWTDEQRKSGSARRQAGQRQARSFRGAGRPSVRNIVKASQGSRAAVFKRIRNGGCKTKKSLGAQLDYVNDKAIFTYSTMTNALVASETLTEGQKESIVEQWAATWNGTSKLGFTSHMLLSFPKDVTADQVRDIAMDWCEHFFESGYYGDEWDYVLAVHTDREHPHAHILLNNRGNDQGQWFACWAEGVMSPQLMREKQAEIAETYGVALDATTRLERGIFAKPAGLEEIYAAKAEGRVASEVALTEQERSMAQAAMIEFAKDYRDVADTLDRSDKYHLSKAVRVMAKSLDVGTEWKIEKEDIDMAEINTVSEAIEFAEVRIDAIQEKAAGLDEPERSQFEIKAAPVIASLSQMVPDPELRTRYNEELVDPYPPGVGGDGIANALVEGQRTDALKETLEYGASIGLNTADTLARLEAGGTKNHGLAQDWVERDLTAILGCQDIEMVTATPEQIDEAVENLDAFQLRLADDLGVEMTSAFSVLEREGQGADEATLDGVQNDNTIALVEDQGIASAQASLSDNETPNAYIRTLAAELREGNLTSEQEEIMERTLVAELHKELGDEGMAELDRGHFEVLEGTLPSKYDQIGVTQEYLEIAAEERGLPELSQTAGDLQQQKVTEQANEATIEENRKDRGLDDDMRL